MKKSLVQDKRKTSSAPLADGPLMRSRGGAYPQSQRVRQHKPFWRRLLFWLPFLAALACFVFLKICEHNPWAAENYARYVFPYVTYVPRMLNTFIPFSLTEFIVVVGGALLIVGIIASVVRLIIKGERRAFLRKWAWSLFLVLTVGYCLFFLNFGFCYHRLPLHENMGLEPKARSKEELREAGLWIVAHLNELSPEVGRDEKGLFTPRMTMDEIMSLSNRAYKLRSEEGDSDFVRHYLYRGPVRTKPVLLSYYWSYTGISGVYVPFLTESSVNVAARPDDIIFTAMHEVAHSYGFAREDEANFLAFYNGILHPNPEVRYACWLSAFSYTSNALYGVDKDMYHELYEKLPREAHLDLQAAYDFWHQFDGPVEEISTKVNNAYLKVNKVEDGVKSYGRVVDLILAYYAKYPEGPAA